MNLTKSVKQELLLTYIKTVYFSEWESKLKEIQEVTTKLANTLTAKQHADFLTLPNTHLNYVNSFTEVKVNIYYTAYWGNDTHAKTLVNMLHLVKSGASELEYGDISNILNPINTKQLHVYLNVPRYLAESPTFSMFMHKDLNDLFYSTAQQVFSIDYIKKTFNHIKAVEGVINSCTTAKKLEAINPKLASLLPEPVSKPNQIVPSELIQQINKNLS